MGRKNKLDRKHAVKKVISTLTLFVLLLGTIGQLTGAGETTPLVNIGLAFNQSEIILSLTGSETILDLGSSPARTLFIPGDQEIISCMENVLYVNDLPVGTGPLLVIPATNFLTWSSRNYRGMFLIKALNGKPILINRLELEEYLKGVIPREVLPDWPAAALKAQAIAARTYTCASLKRHQDDGFDLCATDHCQVYGGASAEQPSTNQAVMETAGQVLTYKGKIIGAFYHAAAGGCTEDVANVWNSTAPYLKAVVDWDQNSPYTRWTRIFTWPELQGLVTGTYPGIGRLKQLLPTSFEKDGRVSRLVLKGDLGEVSLTGAQFRSLTGVPGPNMQFVLIYGPEPFITLSWVGRNLYPEVITPSDIPGITAEILDPPWDEPDPWAWLADKDPVKLVIRGSGWGHGVGLSQWGAKGMADFGYNERQILAHYYPGTVIMDINKLK